VFIHLFCAAIYDGEIKLYILRVITSLRCTPSLSQSIAWMMLISEVICASLCEGERESSEERAELDGFKWSWAWLISQTRLINRYA